MPLPKTKSQLAIEKLWSFEGRDAAFWVEMLRVFSLQLEAASGMILVKLESETGEAQWSPVAVWPDSEETKQRLSALRKELTELAATTSESEPRLQCTAGNEGIRSAALPLRIEDEKTTCVATFIRYGSEDFFQPSQRIEKLMMDTPLIYGANPLSGSAPDTGTNDEPEPPLVTALTVGILVNEETRFLAAAMVLCNELASRYGADRVSLGWLCGNYIKLKATNHTGKINRKMELSRLLEAAMEESIEQDDEIVWPGTATGAAIERDHERYARKAGVAHVASVPLRLDSSPLAAVTVERVQPFGQADIEAMRLTSDLCVRRLVDLYERDRWFGARWAGALRKGLGKVIGFEHTWIKVGALATTALLAFLVLYPWPYKVKASFILQPAQVFHLPAPFDGYIESVSVRAGDAVKKDQVLVTMDTAELDLNRAELSATIQRYVSEAQLARAEATPAEMHIAIAQAEETKSALQKVQYNLEMASVKAPEDGVVLEGEMEDRIGSPVTRGEALLKLSQLKGMFAELRVPEADATRVAIGSEGEVAFESRPEEHFPIEVTEIEPLAIPEEKGTLLIARTRFSGEAPDWWRPGMTGSARIHCGTRSPLWIITHRAIDYLRMRFWL
ncbi:MAG: efflux RND transporter periplasmic adaptor subunit [Verrucomicrobiales bacterium]|nr:efflux RND transporter periplasmic adaptor subunit [Verrucomicrobiales bacterium]